MRTRNEIIEFLRKSKSTVSDREVMVELLLDIRDLLVEANKVEIYGVPVEEKKCCIKCDGCFVGNGKPFCDTCPCHKEKRCCDKCVMFTNGYCDKCHSPKDNPATTVAKFVDFLDKETLNPYDVRVEPTTDKEEWGEADFQALFAGYYSSQNKIREFIHRAEKEAVQKSRKDWLREEIERLERMKRDRGGLPYKVYAKEDAIYNKALSDIQDHYQKELALITNKGDTNN